MSPPNVFSFVSYTSSVVGYVLYTLLPFFQLTVIVDGILNTIPWNKCDGFNLGVFAGYATVKHLPIGFTW